MIVDTHCHLYDEAFRPDFDDVLTRAREAGLEACVMPGIDRSCHESLVAMADALPGFAFPCIGLHPTSVSETWEEELAFVKEHFADRRWYAVGEIGLDEYWSKDFVKEQIRVLEEQIVLAAEAGLPVIIHLREATDDFFRVLEDLRGVDFRGVMHAYSGSYETYRRLLTYADFRFGIGGVVTYKNAGVALAVEKMSLDDIVTETDCPWLTPVPFRGKRNEPSYVRLVVEKIAQIKQLPYEDVAASTTRNARRLFNL
ncbi:MAG: TatD family hydrolase [Bacteroidales bacterium]|nr:TatD family hydrolase [Bacteroidales bacterium]MBQ1754836.1 TatD family hydrolase [Bacteroidales bacterium]MBQ1831073.1 TatD family hydrolase [Bacteroidales bacterium]MCR5744458.1 TatD family hydrolase [Bacteroidales bacterium]